MEWAHALIAILSAFRLTLLFTKDAIFAPVRQIRYIPWHCELCMSVWGGAVATVILVFSPWLNWPLALSWLYLTNKDSKVNSEKPVKNSEDEFKIRAQAESQMLGALLQPGINQAVVLAGEVAVLRAKLAEAEKKPE